MLLLVSFPRSGHVLAVVLGLLCDSLESLPGLFQALQPHDCTGEPGSAASHRVPVR